MIAMDVRFSLGSLVHNMTRSAMSLMVFSVLVGVGNCGSGCREARSAAEVEAAYTSEIVYCSVSAKTLSEAKECRLMVNKKYGLCDRDGSASVTPCDE